jgi:3-hydroxymyristoyl/3-hydroxydecanoyl-(acyl carrier protein) dehydratase
MLELAIPADHPAFPGHFPGMPIVPGVVLLDAALAVIGRALGRDIDDCRIASAKFLSPVLPGQALGVEHALSEAGALRFTVWQGTRKVLTAACELGLAQP